MSQEWNLGSLPWQPTFLIMSTDCLACSLFITILCDYILSFQVVCWHIIAIVPLYTCKGRVHFNLININLASHPGNWGGSEEGGVLDLPRWELRGIVLPPTSQVFLFSPLTFSCSLVLSLWGTQLIPKCVCRRSLVLAISVEGGTLGLSCLLCTHKTNYIIYQAWCKTKIQAP